ncbi:hypothetical protein MMC12_008135 [Toensbergia leucococca]|nr:hypothetical protein [Toensbergia leucococca]
MDQTSAGTHMTYSTVTGYFMQDDLGTDASRFDYKSVNFGLKNRSYSPDEDFESVSKKTQWQRFEQEVSRLNHESKSTVRYKVLFLGRHGQGVHNVAESFYGTSAWDCYWAKQEGNGTVNWVDAHLTELGKDQAQVANQFWSKMIADQKIPVPQKYYTSPLDRCLSTARLTFSGLMLPTNQAFTPTVKELLRETNGVHTCDRRSPKSYIQNEYPTYEIEVGFTEEDELWLPDKRESNSALDARMKLLLDDILTDENSDFISLTSHSGAIASILRVIGHREFRLVTGSVIPVLVKSEINSKLLPPTSVTLPTPAPTCESEGH